MYKNLNLMFNHINRFVITEQRNLRHEFGDKGRFARAN